MDGENIRDESLGDLTTLLKNLISSEQYKRKLSFYTGKIEDNNDPEKLGRCRIRVYGQFSDEIPTKDLPWANPDFTFIGSTLGSFIVPPIDTLVKVYFEQDDPYRPMYTTKIVDRNKLSNEKDEDYPSTMILFESDLGDYFKINTATGESTYRHASGVIITLNKEGEITIDSSTTNSGKYTLNIKGNVSVVSEGDVLIEAAKGSIKLGGNEATQPCNNLPFCIFSGAPHSIGRQLPGTPGSTNVRA
jgi:hypothetical protein